VVLINRFVAEQMTVIIERGNRNVFEKMKAKKSKSKDKDKDALFSEAIYLMSTVTEGLKGGYNALRSTVIKHCMNLTSKAIF